MIQKTYATNYDLRYVDGPIRDQGSLGSCQAFATTTIIDTIMRQAGHELPLLSPLAYYAEIRNVQNTFNTDSGTYQAGGEQAAINYGFAKESSWSYDESKLYTQLPQSVVEEASHIKVTSFTSLRLEVTYTTLVNEVKDALGQGKPVLLTFKPQAYFYNEHGDLNTVTNLGQNGLKAGHAVEIIGADDNLNGGSYIVHNSWNTSWGDNGYGVISYQQFKPSGFIDDLMGMYTIDGMKVDNTTLDFRYTTSRVTVSEYYSTILERAAEVSGLDFWANQNLSHETLANYLINSDEGKIKYAGLNNTQFVQELYHNVVGRDGDKAGVDLYVGLLDGGHSRAWLMSTVIDYLYTSGTDATDRQYITNKVDVANYITIASQYTGGQDSVTHNILEQVTSDINAVQAIKIGVQEALQHHIFV